MAPYIETQGWGSKVTVRFSSDEGLPRFETGYWSIQGLGSIVRMLLCASGVDHVVALYDLDENGDAGWMSSYYTVTKPELSKTNPFMNLPYVIDHEKKLLLTQTNAILSYLGKELGMMGKDEGESAIIEQLLCEMNDIRSAMSGFAYGSDTSADAAAAAISKASGHFAKFEAHLANKDVKHFLVGEKISAADFALYLALFQFAELSKQKELGDFFANFPSLRAFKDGFENLKENQLYLNSILHKGMPFNAAMATFGSGLGSSNYVRGQECPWKNLGEIVLKPE